MGWKQIDSKVKKVRSMEMTQLFESYNLNNAQINTEQLVLITEVHADQYVGHNKEYVKVVLDIDSIQVS